MFPHLETLAQQPWINEIVSPGRESGWLVPGFGQMRAVCPGGFRLAGPTTLPAGLGGPVQPRVPAVRSARLRLQASALNHISTAFRSCRRYPQLRFKENQTCHGGVAVAFGPGHIFDSDILTGLRSLVRRCQSARDAAPALQGVGRCVWPWCMALFVLGPSAGAGPRSLVSGNSMTNSRSRSSAPKGFGGRPRVYGEGLRLPFISRDRWPGEIPLRRATLSGICPVGPAVPTRRRG